MTPEAIANAIRSAFKTNIADANSLLTLYDNQDEGTFDKPDNAMWCRLSIRDGDNNQVATGGSGGNTFRRSGVMIAQLFSPLGLGDKDQREMAGKIEAVFRCTTISSVKFRTPDMNTVGRTQGGDEWQVNVTCPFYANDTG